MARKAHLHGVEPARPEPWPVFEVFGAADVGKKLVAELVAKRLGGYCVHLPCLDLQSFTGRALLHAIAHQAPLLEREPHWWAHLYAANMHEQRGRIEALREHGPVVVVNYMWGFRTWMRAAGVESLDGFFGRLPEPLHGYSLVGHGWQTPGNLNLSFSATLLNKVQRASAMGPGKKTTVVKVQEGRPNELWRAMNRAAMDVCASIRERYRLDVDEGQLYTPSLAARKS